MSSWLAQCEEGGQWWLAGSAGDREQRCDRGAGERTRAGPAAWTPIGPRTLVEWHYMSSSVIHGRYMRRCIARCRPSLRDRAPRRMLIVVELNRQQRLMHHLRVELPQERSNHPVILFQKQVDQLRTPNRACDRFPPSIFRGRPIPPEVWIKRSYITSLRSRRLLSLRLPIRTAAICSCSRLAVDR